MFVISQFGQSLARRLILSAVCILMVQGLAVAQKYISEKSTITFFSSAPLEDIKASNSESRSVFDSDEGEIVFSIPISKFKFKKSLMQEHFNEKYLESDKYPKSTFSGKIEGYEKGISNKEVWTEGELEIHGVKNTIRIPGSLTFKGDKISIESTFTIKIADYKIKIPSLLFQNIAEEVEVTVQFDYKLYDN